MSARSVDTSDLAGMPADCRRRKMCQLRDKKFCPCCADEIGGGVPSGAKHDSDVEAGSSRQPADVRRRRFGSFEGLVVGIRHKWKVHA